MESRHGRVGKEDLVEFVRDCHLVLFGFLINAVVRRLSVTPIPKDTIFPLVGIFLSLLALGSISLLRKKRV